MSLQQPKSVPPTLKVREDFRRDGLAATFLVEESLFSIFSSAFPANTRFNIGYPSICGEEENVCRRILDIENHNGEFCVVGHAREFDLDTMSSLLSGRENVSANIWLPSSEQSAKRILGYTPAQVLQVSLNAIKYWKSVSDKPLDIALTDATAPEPGMLDRLHQWLPLLIDAGYREVILCDTKGVGEKKHLLDLFRVADSFEWHPHNDNGFAMESTRLALENGATRIGTSFLKCSERMNMIDPREFPELDIHEGKLREFIEGFNERFGSMPELRNSVYGSGLIITGTHHLMWGVTPGHLLSFGVTSNTSQASEMLGTRIHSGTLRLLKDELLYKKRQVFISKEAFIQQAMPYISAPSSKSIPQISSWD